MTEIRNLAGKLVCRLDEATGTIEIVSRGHRTLIRFNASGKFKVAHEKV